MAKRSQLAEAIAHDLFVDGGTNSKARRLVLDDGGKVFQGRTGWSEDPVADRVDLALASTRKEIANALLWLREERGGYRTLAIEQLEMAESRLRFEP